MPFTTKCKCNTTTDFIRTADVLKRICDRWMTQNALDKIVVMQAVCGLLLLKKCFMWHVGSDTMKSIREIYEYDLDSSVKELDEYCKSADFVFNLAGVNRPENPEDFMKGNFGFASQLLDT